MSLLIFHIFFQVIMFIYGNLLQKECNGSYQIYSNWVYHVKLYITAIITNALPNEHQYSIDGN